MDLLEIAGKTKIQKHFLDDGSEEEHDPLMESNCIQYRVAGGEGSIPLRLVSDPEPSTSSATGTNNVQAVLASPLNGQFYVIGSPTEVLGPVGQRNIAPRTFSLESSGSGGSGIVSNHSASTSKEEKQGNRRATHNEVERRRRDNINQWIMKLGKLIPPEMGGIDNSQGGKHHAQSKGGILAKACEYLADTRNTNENLRDSLKALQEVTADNDRLTSQVQRLQRENELLREQLQQQQQANSTAQPTANSLLKSEMDFNM